MFQLLTQIRVAHHEKKKKKLSKFRPEKINLLKQVEAGEKLDIKS